MRKDRSCSAGLLEFPTTASPDAIRKNKEKISGQYSASKLKNTHTSISDITIFHIPGMDVKIQYQSKVKEHSVELNEL